MRLPQGITSQLANAITLVRMLLMPLSLAVVDRPWLFALLWVMSGVSDGVDGFVARRLGTQSEAGARLDWLADVVMYGVMVIFYWRVIVPALPWVGVGIVVVLVVRLVNLWIGWRRFGKIGGVHTIGNKVAGAAVFAAPALYLVTGLAWLMGVVLVVALLSALEEMVVLARMRAYDPNAKSVFTMPE